MSDDKLARNIHETYTLDNGDKLDIYRTVTNDRQGQKWVEQQDINGREIGHTTKHGDGTVHNHGQTFLQQGRRIAHEGYDDKSSGSGGK